jgi:hypothetical protein
MEEAKKIKNLLLKLRKSEGYIGVETMIIAALVIAAGFIALKTVVGDLEEKAVGFNDFLGGMEHENFVVGEN